MGAPVVHFEVIGSDGGALRSFYSRMFDWEFTEIDGPTDYRVVKRDGNTLEPDEVPGAGILLAHVRDPEGHLIGLVQPL